MTFQRNIIRQLRREMAEEGERLSLWLPVFLAIGIGLYFSLGHEPPAAILEQPGWCDLSGRIIAINQYGKGIRLLLDEVRLRSLPVAQTPVLIRVRVSSVAAPFGIGNGLECRGLLRPSPPSVMPGAVEF